MKSWRSLKRRSTLVSINRTIGIKGTIVDYKLSSCWTTYTMECIRIWLSSWCAFSRFVWWLVKIWITKPFYWFHESKNKSNTLTDINMIWEKSFVKCYTKQLFCHTINNVHDCTSERDTCNPPCVNMAFPRRGYSEVSIAWIPIGTIYDNRI